MNHEAGAVGTDDHSGPDLPDAADAALARFILELRSRGLTDPALLNAFERLPRERFIPAFGADRLYSPLSLPIACGEEATDPYTLARHLRQLDVRPGHRVLEIGTGSGFQAAVMARLGASVASYDRYRTLLRGAEQALRASSIFTVSLGLADGMDRLDRSDPFDRIIINGAIESMPAGLLDRLNPHGIAMAARRRGLETRLVLWRKDLSGDAAEQDLGNSRLGPLRDGLPSVL